MQDVLPRDAIPSIDDPSFDTTDFGDTADGMLGSDEGAAHDKRPIAVI